MSTLTTIINGEDTTRIGDITSVEDATSVGDITSVGDTTSVEDITSAGDITSVEDITNIEDTASVEDKRQPMEAGPVCWPSARLSDPGLSCRQVPVRLPDPRTLLPTGGGQVHADRWQS